MSPDLNPPNGCVFVLSLSLSLSRSLENNPENKAGPGSPAKSLNFSVLVETTAKPTNNKTPEERDVWEPRKEIPTQKRFGSTQIKKPETFAWPRAPSLAQIWGTKQNQIWGASKTIQQGFPTLRNTHIAAHEVYHEVY